MTYEDQLKERAQKRLLACASACIYMTDEALHKIALEGGIPALQAKINSLAAQVLRLQVLETA